MWLNPMNWLFYSMNQFYMCSQMWDLWVSHLFLPTTTMTKCNVFEEIFKVCVIKSYYVASLLYEPVLPVLTEIFESHSCFFQTQQRQNVIVLKKYSKFVWSNPIKWLFYSMNQFYMCWQKSLRVTTVSSKHNTDKM